MSGNRRAKTKQPRGRPDLSAAATKHIVSVEKPAPRPDEFRHLPGLQVRWQIPERLEPYDHNARTHSPKQIEQIAASIRQFGFINPVLIDQSGQIVAGHGRVAAAILMGLPKVPTIRLDHLSDAERRAYAIADNRIAERAGWDMDTLAIELRSLSDLELDFNLEFTGYETAEIDQLLELSNSAGDLEDEVPNPPLDTPAISRTGDVWQLGRHRLTCGDVRERDTLDRLMPNELAAAAFTDPPYNVRIDGHARGQGRVSHREFAMASGEMSQAAFTQFLEQSLGNLAAKSADGAIHFVCMDWRHLVELLTAGKSIYSEFKNLAVWVKENAGLGSFYRSQHELICIFKKGHSPHLNNFGLGANGRYRTNVWQYAGINAFKHNRAEELDMHPTVKPVALVMDAIKDVTKRGQIILDGFAGSGTTIIAAEKTGRVARAVEIDPAYVDVSIQRWQRLTKQEAQLADSGESFSQIAHMRALHSTPPIRQRKHVGR